MATVTEHEIFKWSKKPYGINIRYVEEENGDKYVIAYHPDFGHSACSATGDTIVEALENLVIARRDIIEHYLRTGKTIPKPRVWGANKFEPTPPLYLLKVSDPKLDPETQKRIQEFLERNSGPQKKAVVIQSGCPYCEVPLTTLPDNTHMCEGCGLTVRAEQ
jgi:predicted RNase H-like HicB family nuclease